MEVLRDLIAVLPSGPGVYQFFDEHDRIIYVGKAKNLKRRVASYFNREPDNGKTRVLVKKIRDIRHIVVNSEEDALDRKSTRLNSSHVRISYAVFCLKKKKKKKKKTSIQ